MVCVNLLGYPVDRKPFRELKWLSSQMNDIKQFSKIHLVPSPSIADEPLLLMFFEKYKHNQVFVCQSLI